MSTTSHVRPVDPDTWYCRDELSPKAQPTLVEFGGLDPAPADVVARLAKIKDPLDYRAAAVAERVPDHADDLAIVRAALLSAGAAPYLEDRPQLVAAVLHGVYDRLADTQAPDSVIAEEALALWEEVRPLAYEDKIRRTLLSTTGISITRAEQRRLRDRMQSYGVPYDSPKLAEYLLRDDPDLVAFEHAFTKAPRGATTVLDDVASTVPRSAVQRSAQVLREIGVEPDFAGGWGKIAYTSALQGPGGEGLRPDLPELPDLESAAALGIDAKRIETCGVLYVVYEYDRLGVLEAVDELADRAAERVDLGDGDLAMALYLHVKRGPHRLPTAYRRRITGRLFESGPEGQPTFEKLMCRLADHLAEFNRLRVAAAAPAYHGGHATPPETLLPVVAHAITELQLHLSQGLGAVGAFVARDTFGQLVECLEILRSDEVLAYAGGDPMRGPLSIVEQLVDTPDDARRPPAEQVPALANAGRAFMQRLADLVGTAIVDCDLDSLAADLYVWLAAVRAADAGDQGSAGSLTSANGSGKVIELSQRTGLRGALSW